MIQFELVTPVKQLLSEKVAMVIVPGTNGDMGILDGHAPVLSSLRPGLVSVMGKDDSPKKHYLVRGGTVEVQPHICTVLAEEASDIKDVNLDELHAELAALIKDGDEEGEAIAVLESMIEAVKTAVK